MAHNSQRLVTGDDHLNIDADRLALLIGRLVLQAEVSAQQVEKLTKELEAAKAEPKNGD